VEKKKEINSSAHKIKVSMYPEDVSILKLYILIICKLAKVQGEMDKCAIV
jgi:hypothetical protein